MKKMERIDFIKNKRLNLTNKTMTIALILILTLTIFTIAIPQTSAQQTSKKTYAFLGVTPDTVGVGQSVLLHLGISDTTMWPQSGWTGLTVKVNRPDGSTETLGPFSTDTTGGTGAVYTPTMTGNYTFQTIFPEQKNTVAVGVFPVGTTFQASESELVTLLVTETPIEYYPDTPLPTEYWSRPINAQYREWSPIAGNWLAPSSLFGTDTGQWYKPYNDAPESPHILWSMPIGDTMGGLAGGETGDSSYGTGDAYEGKWSGSVIISGVLFYNKFEANKPTQEIVAVNIRTGEVLWTKNLNNSRIGFGQVLDWKGFNYMGTFSYLWTTSGTTWNAYEPLSGEWIYSLKNVPQGTNLYGPNGEILRYVADLKAGWLALWNSTKAVKATDTLGNEGSWGRDLPGKTYDAQQGFEWNKTIPLGLPGSVRVAFYNDRLIGSHNNQTEVTIWGINLKEGQEGTLMFKSTWAAPSEWIEGNLEFAGRSGGWVAFSQEDKVGVLSIKETRTHYGFSLETGKYLWGPTPSQNYLDQYFGDCKFIAYGNFYSANVGGIVYCYDVKTGALLWTYKAEDPYTEYQFGNYWWLEQMFATDGKVYFGHAEHSANNPRPRGAPFICLNATTGDEIWRIDGLLRTSHWGGTAIIGDSVIVMQNTYDQQIYAVGKGPSAITATAPNTGVPFGSSILISGTVTDVSPGTKQTEVMLRFPNGVPAVSDESMGAWMKYVYQQATRPTNATGVLVKISVLDANGNYREIGTTQTDSNGFYSLNWKPDIEGKYTVYASFEGSESYWPTQTTTAFTVDPLEATPTPQPTQTPSTADLYILPGIAGIIITIIIVGVAIILFQRKRP
jgi:outer membrane protein assembly factor BamB